MSLKWMKFTGWVVALSLAGVAQAGTPNIDERQAHQEQRIDQGIQSGSLTPKEAARLERQEARINRMEDNAKADGVVTQKERRKIRHAQDVESRRIHRQKHDLQTRP